MIDKIFNKIIENTSEGFRLFMILTIWVMLSVYIPLLAFMLFVGWLIMICVGDK